VAFRAEHVEPAEGHHLVVLRGHGLLGRVQRIGPGGLVLLGRLGRIEAPAPQVVHRDVLGVATEHDVGTAAGHVRGDRDLALPARHRHDRRLTLVLLRVQHVVRDAPLLQQGGEDLRLLHRCGAHQHRLSGGVPVRDVLDDGVELAGDVLVDEVRVVPADHRLVRGDRHDADLVGVQELGGLGLGGTGHARELGVEAEVVLQGDRGERLVLGLDLHPLLGLDGLVHALVVPPAGQHTAGVLVDDQNLTVADDVVLVPLEQLLRLDGVVEEGDERGVERLVQVVDAEEVLDLLDARL